MGTDAVGDSWGSGDATIRPLGLRWLELWAQDVPPVSVSILKARAFQPGTQILPSPSVGWAKALVVSDAMWG